LPDRAHLEISQFARAKVGLAVDWIVLPEIDSEFRYALNLRNPRILCSHARQGHHKTHSHVYTPALPSAWIWIEGG